MSLPFGRVRRVAINAVRCAVALATVIAFAMMMVAADDGPPVARTVVVARIAETHLGFGQLFAAAAAARERLAIAADAGGKAANVLAFRELERLLAIPDAIEWEHGFARRDGTPPEPEDAEPQQEVADAAVLERAYDRWTEERLRPLLHAHPAAFGVSERDIVRLRPKFRQATPIPVLFSRAVSLVVVSLVVCILLWICVLAHVST